MTLNGRLKNESFVFKSSEPWTHCNCSWTDSSYIVNWAISAANTFSTQHHWMTELYATIQPWRHLQRYQRCIIIITTTIIWLLLLLCIDTRFDQYHQWPCHCLQALHHNRRREWWGVLILDYPQNHRMLLLMEDVDDAHWRTTDTTSPTASACQRCACAVAGRRWARDDRQA